jgi:serine/threonine-protein kinase
MPVAIKRLKGEEKDWTADQIERFEREASAAMVMGLATEHAVRVLDHGRDERGPFLVMELLEGELLQDRLDARGLLSAPETARIVVQVNRALRRAHSLGLVHRDVKPSNVFLAFHPGEEERAKILDWGTCKRVAPGGPPMQTLMAGTPYFMSPEVVDSQPIDARADVWSVGVLAYLMLAGRPPFEGGDVRAVMRAVREGDAAPPSSIVRRISPAIDEFFARALARDIRRRFQTIDELEEAFLSALGRRATETGPRSLGRHRARAAALSAAARKGRTPARTLTDLMPTLRSAGCGRKDGEP